MLFEIVRQSIYTHDIQTASKPQQLCTYHRSGYDCAGYCIIAICKISLRIIGTPETKVSGVFYGEMQDYISQQKKVVSHK